MKRIDLREKFTKKIKVLKFGFETGTYGMRVTQKL